MEFNVNTSAPLPRDDWWGSRKKIATELQPTVTTAQVLEACTYKQEFGKQGAKVLHEVLELAIELFHQDKPTGKYFICKLRGGAVDPATGQAVHSPSTWNICAIANKQNEAFLKDSFDGSHFDRPCKYYPNFAGIKLKVVVASTGNFNGYFTYSSRLFSPEGFSGKELQAGATTQNDLIAGKAAIDKGFKKFKEESVAYTSSGFAPAYAGKTPEPMINTDEIPF